MDIDKMIQQSVPEVQDVDEALEKVLKQIKDDLLNSDYSDIDMEEPPAKK